MMPDRATISFTKSELDSLTLALSYAFRYCFDYGKRSTYRVAKAESFRALMREIARRAHGEPADHEAQAKAQARVKAQARKPDDPDDLEGCEAEAQLHLLDPHINCYIGARRLQAICGSEVLNRPHQMPAIPKSYVRLVRCRECERRAPSLPSADPWQHARVAKGA